MGGGRRLTVGLPGGTVFNKGDYLRTIAAGLAGVERTCELQGILKLFDDHVLAEQFFCRMLNSAYQLRLQHMEQIQANHPAIDLGDAQNRVAYQVTADKSSEKVQHTLDKFVEKGFEKQFDRLRILIIGNRQSAYKSVTIPAQLRFDCDEDIIGIPEFTKYIGTLNTSRLRELSEIMDEELKSRGPAAFPMKWVGLCAALTAGAMGAVLVATSLVEPPMARLSLGSSAAPLARVTHAFAKTGNEFRSWEELKSPDDREKMLAFTDRFVRCPIQFAWSDPPTKMTGIRFDFDIKRGTNSKQLILRDVVVEVVRFHSVAPTFWLGAARPKKPLVVVEMSNRRAPLPWNFRAKWIADSTEEKLEEFDGHQVLIERTDWETFLLKLESKDRGIYEFNIDVILQQDDKPQTTVRITEKPIAVGFFSRPKETDADYQILRERYMSKGGMMQQILGAE
jgi:hypothetical protein